MKFLAIMVTEGWLQRRGMTSIRQLRGSYIFCYYHINRYPVSVANVLTNCYITSVRPYGSKTHFQQI